MPQATDQSEYPEKRDFKNRTALYVRVSTRRPKAGRGEQDPANQLLQLQNFARAMTWVVVATYEDRESGAKSDRPQFKALMNDAARREFDIVLTWSLDRFSREGISKTFDHLRRLTSCGIRFKSLNEPFLDTGGELGELLVSLFSFIASFERRRICERIAAGLQRARSQGRTLGRPRVIVDGTKVWDLRDAGKSIREIAGMLKLSHGTVQRILHRR